MACKCPDCNRQLPKPRCETCGIGRKAAPKRTSACEGCLAVLLLQAFLALVLWIIGWIAGK